MLGRRTLLEAFHDRAVTVDLLLCLRRQAESEGLLGDAVD
jgi:hypothetical protein